MQGDIGAEVVVVIPYAGQGDLLAVQLDALAAQQDASGFEVVVAVNRDDAFNSAYAAARRTDLDVRVVDAAARRGPSYARNVGWRASSRPLVLFCDADDRCAPGWVATMAVALRASPLVRGTLLYGGLNPVPFAFSRLDPAVHPTKLHHLPFGPSCNLGVRRDLLQCVEGFDERLISGEDIDLCWRAQYAGATLVHVPEAVVEYRLRQDVRSVFEQGVSYGRGGMELLVLHGRHGARRGLGDLLREVAVLCALAPASLIGRAGRFRFALAAGTLFGSLRSAALNDVLNSSPFRSSPVQGRAQNGSTAYDECNSDSYSKSNERGGTTRTADGTPADAR